MHKPYIDPPPTTGYNFEEMCPHCGEWIAIAIDYEDMEHYEITCPICGEKMMLCTLCHWDQSDANEPDHCDWCKETGCYRMKEEKQ